MKGKAMSEMTQYELSERIATVTINRPERRNAMTASMNKEFPKKIREAGEDDSVQVMFVTGLAVLLALDLICLTWISRVLRIR